MTKRIDWLTFAMLAITIVLWSGNAVVGRAVRSDVGPVTLAMLRWTGAAIAILPLAWRTLRTDWSAIKRSWPILLFLSVMGVSAFNTLLYASLQLIPATNALLIQSAIPGLVLMCAFVLFRAGAPRLQVAGVVLSTLGAIYIVFKGDLAAAASLHLGRGDMMIGIACLCWALYTVALRKGPAIAPASFLFVTFVVGALVLAPFLVFDDRPLHVGWTWPVAGAVAYVCLFPSVIAYFLYNASVARSGGVLAGQAISFMPLVGAAMAALLLGERLHGFHALGMAIITAGIVLSVIGARRMSGPT